MKKRNGHLWKLFLCLLFLLLFCSACKQKEPPQSDTTGGNSSQTTDALAPYYMDYGYFYLEDGILLFSDKRMMYSDWEDIKFKYLCGDLTCTHENSECSAFLQSHPDRADTWVGVYYQDKLILVDTYFDGGMIPSEDSELDYTSWRTWKTDVYEADKDGKNRKLVAAFDGGVDLGKAVLLLGDTLYFGGDKKETIFYDFNEESEKLENVEIHLEDNFFALDLSDYSVKTFAEEEKDTNSYLHEVYYKDNAVYAIEMSGIAEKGAFFRLSLEDGTCEKLLQFDTMFPVFIGVIGNQLFYTTDDAVMSYDMDTKESSVFYECTAPIVFMIGNEILIQTESSMEQGSDYSVYTAYDKNEKKLKEYRFDEYIAFMDVIGDKVTYVKCCTPRIEEWWCNISDMEDLLEKSEYIGPLTADGNDTVE